MNTEKKTWNIRMCCDAPRFFQFLQLRPEVGVAIEKLESEWAPTLKAFGQYNAHGSYELLMRDVLEKRSEPKEPITFLVTSVSNQGKFVTMLAEDHGFDRRILVSDPFDLKGFEREFGRAYLLYLQSRVQRNLKPEEAAKVRGFLRNALQAPEWIFIERLYGIGLKVSTS